MSDERWLNLQLLDPPPTSREVLEFGRMLDTDREHLLWNGTVDVDGHGLIVFRGRARRADLVAFAMVHGGYPGKPYRVASRCGQPTCCSPGCLAMLAPGEGGHAVSR